MAVVNGAAELCERRITHTHMDAQRQTSAGEFVPDWQKTRIGNHSFAHGAEDNSGACRETLHFFDRFNGLSLFAERQKPGPFQPLWRVAALCRDVAVVGAKQRRFELGISSHVRIKRARKQHLRIKDHAVHVAETRRRVIQRHAAD